MGKVERYLEMFVVVLYLYWSSQKSTLFEIRTVVYTYMCIGINKLIIHLIS